MRVELKRTDKDQSDYPNGSIDIIATGEDDAFVLGQIFADLIADGKEAVCSTKSIGKQVSIRVPLRKAGDDSFVKEQYDKIQDFVIHNGLYRGQPEDKSHADIVIEMADQSRVGGLMDKAKEIGYKSFLFDGGIIEGKVVCQIAKPKGDSVFMVEATGGSEYEALNYALLKSGGFK